MKQNQSQAGQRNSRAPKSKQSRKVTSPPLPPTPAGQTTATAPEKGDDVSDDRMRAFEHRTQDGFDPSIPGVLSLEWSDGALVDRVCAALHDAEPVLGEVRRCGELPAALVITQRVMERVRARGLRPQCGAAPENWTGALPGMQGQHLDSERATLAFLCDALYMERHALVAEVIPKLELGRALALADALVIAETCMVREGASIDGRADGYQTAVQCCSEHLRAAWLAVHSADLSNMSEDLPRDVIAWAKGGAR